MDNVCKALISGTYRHYKNKKLYKVLCVAQHTETREYLVVYQALYGDGDIWARPATMFTEKVNVDGKEVPRFTLV